ncbi:MAG: FtsW/RodA/SpoVE family cell cycle protein [Actinobacteria bacterium]|jgi:cell division protein FtsW (lipid II flippase)|nr:FtsW/RodA/SpoVE family cell cycle protein [Actinomycetota bacterium]
MAVQTSVRRNRELTLLILALLVGSGAMALVAVARDVEGLRIAAPLIATTAVGYFAVHFLVRRFARQSDPLILPLIAVLNAIGLAAVYRLDPAADGFGPAQVLWTTVGLVCFVGTLLIVRDYRILSRYKYILGFAGVVLLLLPITPLGTTINGARLWLRLGPYSFQPGEIAKICLVIFFAAYLAERKELLSIASRKLGPIHIPDPKHFGPLLLMWGVSLLTMFFLKDLGSSLLFFSIFLVMIYVATARIVYMVFGGLLFGAGAAMGYSFFSHVQVRVQTWLDPFNPEFIQGDSFQLTQSLFAFATGGLFGTGWGQGRPDIIPEAQTDFIFAVIGEELGLMGTAAVIVMFLLLIARGFRVALNSRNDFGQLLACGLTAIFALQTFIILGGVTRVLPLTGITLPFMSFGGSSILSNFILWAILIRISDQNASEPDPARTGEILIGGR